MGVEPPETSGTEGDLPPQLRWLKRLVTVLTVSMIGGVLAITVLLVIRLNADTAPVVIAPGDFVLPEGVGLVGFSIVDGRTVIVGDDGVIRIYDSESRVLMRDFTID
ncbi:DUF6476 family protein [Roseicyclus mahoneyensis]|uniref:DUF6476 family protein n=1 Tax=Roseicyclus mahoneyensis TaxID=164332 RepID=UPI000D6BD06A|nr:DUF6476 family protein [Roseicyclus mahoneyensis]